MKKTQLLLPLFLAAAATFTACSSDESLLANVNIPDEKTLTTGLEANEQVLNFNIESDTEWKIEFDGNGDYIAYAWPQSGRGNATIKLHVLPNMSEVARKGCMKIIFPADASRNKVISLVQKANSAGDDNLDTSLLGDKRYALGWGYDVTKGISARKCLKTIIFKPEFLQEENYVVADYPNKLDKQWYKSSYGATIPALKSRYATVVDEMTFNGLKANLDSEVKSSFNINDFSNEQYEYALTYLDVAKECNRISYYQDCLDEDGLTPAAYKILNNTEGDYPSTDTGFRRLLNALGTHVVVRSSIGGRLKIATRINTSKITKAYDCSEFGKLAYSDIIEDAIVSVEDEYKKSWSECKDACETSVTGFGGSKELLNKIATTTGEERKEYVSQWMNDIETSDNASFMGSVEKNDLIPIYELVEDKDRAEALQTYMESGAYQSQPERNYDLGIQGCLSNCEELIGNINANDYKGALEKKITINDNGTFKTIAMLRSENIPEIDEWNRVAVFYPVINGEVKYNLGIFLGNENNKPCYVSVYGGVKHVRRIYKFEWDEGSISKVYFRGATISPAPIDDETPQVKASIEENN